MVVKKNRNFFKNYFLSDNKSGYKTKINHIEKEYPELLVEIKKHTEKSEYDNDIPFTQMLYNYLYDITSIVNCETCNKPIEWKNRFSEGYRKTCSLKCRNKSLDRIEKIKNTTLEKYGVDSISKVEEFKNKRKKTNKENFGNETYFRSNDFKVKSMKTSNERYGVDVPIQSKDIKEKRKKNSIKKYGVDSPSKLDDVKNKIVETNLERYGVHHVMQNQKIRQKNVNSRVKDRIIQYKNILGEHVDFYFRSGYVEVVNSCEKHNSYIISNTLLYYRLLKYNISNPCVHCNPISYNNSINEEELRTFIKSLGYSGNKKHIDQNEIDIFIEEKNIGIEYNGLYWHSELFKDKNYHINKTDFLSSKGIVLFHIFENEWLYKREIVKSLIKSKLGHIDRKIYARKCNIVNLSNIEVNKFLDDNHLQGHINSNIKLGLIYGDEIVCVMTFNREKRKSMKNKIEDEFELLRFSNKINTVVIGGASKLLKHFIETYKPSMISTFADRRYSTGDLYQRLGFDFKYVVEPNYWYFKNGDNVLEHRFKYRKKQLVKMGYDPDKTEQEIMLDLNYLRVYDCGNIKYEMVIKKNG